MAINFELLREAAAIIDGIPEGQFNLDKIFTVRGKEPCGSIACAAGWLALHPKFQALGLRPAPLGSTAVLEFNGSPAGFKGAMSELFGMSQNEALDLFGPAWSPSINHKALFRRRVVNFLRHHGQEARE